MLTYPHIDPIAFSIGPLPIHWYGLMYLLGFLLGWGLLAYRIRHHKSTLTVEQLSDLVFFTAVGVILGGRIGYVIFYGWDTFLQHPLFLFQTWKGGMSFHGGLIGVILALSVYAIKHKKSLLELTDFIAPVVPVGLGLGRIANFINGELWGRVTDVPWAMIFPAVDGSPRHPSPVYEFFLEGVVLFVLLWTFSNRSRPRGAVSAVFLLGYGIFRFGLEYFREPDIQKGFVAFNWMTQGQLLSIPMIMLGLILLGWAYRGKYR